MTIQQILSSAVLSTLITANLAAEPAKPDFTTERPTYGRWTSSALGGGGFIMGVRFTEADADRLWAHTDVGGIYRSDDGGMSWRNATYTLPYGLDPAEHPDAAPLGDRGLMYVRDMVADPDEPDRAIILVGYEWSPDYGLYVTDDGGETWDNVQPMWAVGDTPHRAYGRGLIRDPSNPTTLYASGRGQGVFRSTDDGDTWTSLGGPEVLTVDLDVAIDDPETLYLSAVAFEDVTRGKGQMPGGLWRSSDGGANWDKIHDRDTYEFEQDPQNPGTLFGIFDDGHTVERSDDGGETWTRSMDDLIVAPDGTRSYNPEHFRYSGLTTGPDFLLLTSAQGDIYRRDDDRWIRVERESVTHPDDWFGFTEQDEASWAPWTNTMNSATGVYVHPLDPENTWWMTDWFSVYKTTDGGETWTNRTNGIEETYVHMLVGDAGDPTRLHLGVADMGYFNSDDAGGHFIRPKREVITNNIAALTTTPAQPGRVYAVGPKPPVGDWYAGHVFISDDHGETWTSSRMQGLPEIDPGGYRANDIAALPAERDTVYLGVSGDLAKRGGLYVSRDGGHSWTLDGEGFPASGDFFVAQIWDAGPTIALAADGTQLVASPTLGTLLRRQGKEGTWQEISSPVDEGLYHLAADPHQADRFFAAVKYGGIYRTDDDGETWQKLDLPASTPGASHLILDPRQPGRLAAGTPRGVILSDDGGQTWTVLDRSLPGRVDWNSGAFVRTEDGTTRLAVGSGGTGVFWTEIE